MSINSQSVSVSLLVGSAMVLGALALAAPAQAYHHKSSGSNLDVAVVNSAEVHNQMYVGASTGDNVTVGGTSGAGAGGHAGAIETGDAIALGSIANVVNTNITDVRGCGCPTYKKRPSNISNGTDVLVANEALVTNKMSVKADTGGNTTIGGDVAAGGTSPSWKWWSKKHSGAGGTGGAGGHGGAITTGIALSEGSIVNLINNNLTRVRP